MNNSFGDWGERIPLMPLDKVIDCVLTGHGTDSLEYTPYPVLHYIGHDERLKSLSILDFGCGVCRNAVSIAKQFPHWNIIGYDNPAMLIQAGDLYRTKFNNSINELQNLKLYSNWQELKLLKFDIIYAHIVFQHIKEKDLNIYLSDIKYMTKNLFVHGRRSHDEIENGQRKNTWRILEKNGFFPPQPNGLYSVDGPGQDHFGVMYKL